jgi:hypothetical protein
LTEDIFGNSWFEGWPLTKWFEKRFEGLATSNYCARDATGTSAIEQQAEQKCIDAGAVPVTHEVRMTLARDPGYQTLRCRTGKTLHPSVNPHRVKYSALPKFGNGVGVAATRPKEEGRIAIVTNAGRAAVDAGHTGVEGSQGG